jgi:hypothetical protein
MDARISKQLFNKRGSIKLEATDVFNTLRDRSGTHYQNLDFVGMDKVETQVVKLIFTYRFGKISLKTTNHQVGNEEEQERLNNKN